MGTLQLWPGTSFSILLFSSSLLTSICTTSQDPCIGRSCCLDDSMTEYTPSFFDYITKFLVPIHSCQKWICFTLHILLLPLHYSLHHLPSSTPMLLSSLLSSPSPPSVLTSICTASQNPCIGGSCCLNDSMAEYTPQLRLHHKVLCTPCHLYQ